MSIRSALQHISEITLDILFPPLCVACRAYLAANEKGCGLCTRCLNSIQIFDTFCCATCGARLPDAKKICHSNTPYILAAATHYSTPAVRLMVWALKYERLRAAAIPLGYLLTQYLGALNYDFSNFLIIPIPLHSARERERGFNQAELLATRIAAHLRIPLATEALYRTRSTNPQAQMENKDSRHENVAGCFATRTTAAVRGKQILLVDDVSTTGSTMAEAVRTLRAAGAKTVIALVAARAY